LKEGENGSSIYYLNEQKEMVDIHRHAHSFDDHPHLSLVDTTGAGDCFTGAFSVKMLEDVPYE